MTRQEYLEYICARLIEHNIAASTDGERIIVKGTIK